MSAMFGQAKPFASLSSGLLARKGQARPAMRSQGFGGFGAGSASLEDLGWNDMGDQPSQPARAQTPIDDHTDTAAEAVPPPPPVVQLREALREEIEAPQAVPAAVETPAVDAGAPAPVALATAARIGRETRATGRKKAAFTLRLDAERHLRLRLASAISRRSAQSLMCEALEHFLESMPEVEELVRQLPAGEADGETRTKR